MDVHMLFFCVFALCFCSAKTESYEIIQNEIAVLGGSVAIYIHIPNMRRPVVWQCQNYKFECDVTCTNSDEFKVMQKEGYSLLWMKKVTEECLTWTFADADGNYGIIHLKISSPTRTGSSEIIQNGLTKAESYEIYQHEIAVPGGRVILYTNFTNMQRPVVWQCQDYKFECDRTCTNGDEFKVVQNNNYSVLWMKKVTEECLTWKFVDANGKGGTIHLKISNSTSSEGYNITRNNPETKAKRLEFNETGTSDTHSIFSVGFVNLGIIILIVTGLCLYKFKKHRRNHSKSDQYI
ncbi:uncharacterized protein LOC115225372 [Octopus sinensis]|uniref:Uncharacterized protein LOC115225372 n=1 Tax=Octopus sinensis TaxID=2607531 RepID=A0A6P7TL56_9MOLL|nr:uncharacterized protein LOC115225372 [Octopus sinensis]XP_036369991.1 uncharacterized protein LOC115225372 [Octopus sinensis]